MVLGIDQSLSKIGYTFLKLPSEYMNDLNSYINVFDNYMKILLLKESQIIKLSKTNIEMNLNILTSKIKWTKQQIIELEQNYNTLLKKQKDLINKYKYDQFIDKTYKSKQIRNVINDFPFKENELSFGLIESTEKNMTRLNEYKEKYESILIENSPQLIVIEGYSYGSSNTRSVFELGELAGTLKLIAYTKNIPVLIVSPSTLKLFITDNGTAQKEDVIKSVKEKFNKEFVYNKNISDDITDSYGLNIIATMFPFLDLDFQIKIRVIKK
jgi:Holliday junction resolvasome RuvABC endonuclease subunit